MKRKSKIEKVIKDYFEPYYFSVLDVSEQHRGHQGFREGVESHFEIVIVSKFLIIKKK
jgi:stress-induced morphogen